MSACTQTVTSQCNILALEIVWVLDELKRIVDPLEHCTYDSCGSVPIQYGKAFKELLKRVE